jgi:hypothetical protein
LLLAPTYLKKSEQRAIGRSVAVVDRRGSMSSSSSSSSSAASASAVFPPSPQPPPPPPPPLMVENLPPLHQLAPVAAPASEQLCYVHCHFCDTVLVVRDRTPSCSRPLLLLYIYYKHAARSPNVEDFTRQP